MKATEVIRLYNRDNSIINSNQIAIAKQVLGLHEINFSQLVVSPFRVDKNPTCSFYISKAGFLLFKDWALDEAYDLVDIICKKLSIGEDEAIKIIKNGEKSTSKVLYTVKSKEVSVLPRQISEFDLYL